MVDMPPRARFPSYYPRFPLFAGSVRLVVNRGLRPQWRTRASRASIAMMDCVGECVRLIIGEGQEVGRSIDPEKPGRP